MCIRDRLVCRLETFAAPHRPWESAAVGDLGGIGARVETRRVGVGHNHPEHLVLSVQSPQQRVVVRAQAAIVGHCHDEHPSPDVLGEVVPVSYTHLDVYKRQIQ